MVTYSAKFCSLEYVSCDRYLKQGVKGHYVPYYAVAGGNGSFICVTPSKLNLKLTTSCGIPFTTDIIRTAREANGWQKITTNRVSMLRNKLCGETFIIEDDKIKNLESLVKV